MWKKCIGTAFLLCLLPFCYSQEGLSQEERLWVDNQMVLAQNIVTRLVKSLDLKESILAEKEADLAMREDVFAQKEQDLIKREASISEIEKICQNSIEYSQKLERSLKWSNRGLLFFLGLAVAEGVVLYLTN